MELEKKIGTFGNFLIFSLPSLTSKTCLDTVSMNRGRPVTVISNILVRKTYYWKRQLLEERSTNNIWWNGCFLLSEMMCADWHTINTQSIDPFLGCMCVTAVEFKNYIKLLRCPKIGCKSSAIGNTDSQDIRSSLWMCLTIIKLLLFLYALCWIFNWC